MAAETLISDPTLLSVLEAAIEARKQCLNLIDLLDSRGGVETPADALDEELSNEQRQLTARLAILRGLNRKAVMGVRATKQETTEKRQEIDSLLLQLQNLYYEQRHLRGEIAGCEDFDHKYQRLPMIPVDDFIAAHPEYANVSDHELTLARIKDEHEARQVLEEQRLQLVKRKDVLVKETNAKKEELGKLDMEIEKWIAGQEAARKLFAARDKKLAEAKEMEAKETEEASTAT